MHAVPRRGEGPSRVVAFDVETRATGSGSALEPYRGARIFSYALCWEDERVEVVRSREKSEQLQRLLLDRDVAIVAHNLKFEVSLLSVHGYTVPAWRTAEGGYWHDTMLQAQLLDNLAESHGLGELGARYLGWETETDALVEKLARASGGYDKVPVELMDRYQRGDVQRTLALHLGQYPQIAGDALLLEDYRNEVALALVVQRMEQRGVQLDTVYTRRQIVECGEKAERATNDMYSATHERINIGSSKQLEWLLFTQLRLPRLPDTRAETLAEFAKEHPHPVFDIIQRHRTYTKAASIAEGYLSRADEEGNLYPSLGTNHADTGRMTCQNPNLQNVAKATKTGNPYMVPARNCFRPRSGWGFITSDESGIELRLIVEAAQCRFLREMLARGEHPHVWAARTFYQQPGWRKTAETKMQYDTAKNTHFALCYGSSLAGYLRTLKHPDEDAAVRGYYAWRAAVPEVADLVRSGISRTKRNGYAIVTPFGRTLRISPKSVHAWLSYYIQGTAAGIIKRAQVRSEHWLAPRWGGAVRMLLSIHDEIIYEVRAEVLRSDADRSRLLGDISECMTRIPHITVPLEAEHKMTYTRWGEAQEVHA